MDLCIYCQRESSDEAPPEHIVPEVLGCPEGAVLRGGEVCKRCNNGLAHLDLALADTFDLMRFVAGQPGKKGRSPSITGRPNLFTTHRDGSPVLYVNFGPGNQTLPNGRVLKAPTTPKSVRGTITVDGQQASISFSGDVFFNPKFSRAVHKVSIGVIAKVLGREAALSPMLDSVRQFVVSGGGAKRSVLYSVPQEWRYVHVLQAPHTAPEGHWVCMVLCGVRLVVDCTPTQASVPELLTLLQEREPLVHWKLLT